MYSPSWKRRKGSQSWKQPVTLYPNQETQEDVQAHAQIAFSILYTLESPVQGMFHPQSLNNPDTHPQACPEVCLQVVLDTVKLTIRTNNHNIKSVVELKKIFLCSVGGDFV